MKTYPKLTYYDKHDIGKSCYAFDKIDGSNIRCEWNRKRGWYKFGTRKTMIGDESHDFYDAKEIFMEKYSDSLSRIFRDRKEYRNSESFVVFLEYFGETSFAGFHTESDKKDMILFDVSQYKRGIIPPKEFIKNFENTHIPDIIFTGQLTEKFIQDVQSNRFGLKEGVMIKGTEDKTIWIKKIKTFEWLQKVKNKYGEKFIKEDCDMRGDIFNQII